MRGKKFAQQTEKHLFTYLPIHLFTSKKVAFTLAEVLITLGIIGVVAAITMPTLMAKYQNLVLSTQLKKVVNNIDNGTKAYLAKEGLDNLQNSSLVEPYNRSEIFLLNTERFVSHFKFEPLLHNTKFEKDIKSSGLGFNLDGDFYYSPDGSFWYILSKWLFGEGREEVVIFDTNGDKGPNKWGYDRFLFQPSMGYCADYKYDMFLIVLGNNGRVILRT